MMPGDLDRTYSYGSTKSSSIRTNNANYAPGVAGQKERVSPSSSSNNGKPPTYTLQKAARMTAKVNHKWVRIASVLAYLVAISMTAVLLALYYILFYNPYKNSAFEPQQDDVLNAVLQPHEQQNLGLSVPPQDHSLPNAIDSSA